jgi:hypothetical protein
LTLTNLAKRLECGAFTAAFFSFQYLFLNNFRMALHNAGMVALLA